MHFIELLPLWAVFALTSLVVILSIEAGFKFAAFHNHRFKPENEAVLNSSVQATLGLLAFVLAFTFGVSAERFNDRRVLVIEEANTIGTTFLRSEFLPDARKNDIQNLLRSYVELRLKLARDPSFLPEALSESRRIQGALWRHAVEVGKSDLNSDVVALFIESVNDTFELQSRRVAAALYARVPESIWAVLFGMVVLSMGAVGYHFGSSGNRSWPSTIFLTSSFAIVIMMIAGLDRPGDKFLGADQRPLVDLSNKIGLPTK